MTKEVDSDDRLVALLIVMAKVKRVENPRIVSNGATRQSYVLNHVHTTGICSNPGF